MMVHHSLVSAGIKQRVTVEKKAASNEQQWLVEGGGSGGEEGKKVCRQSRQKACRQPGAVAGVRGWVVQLGHASHIAAQHSGLAAAWARIDSGPCVSVGQ